MDWMIPIISAVFAAGGAYAGVYVELKYMRRDIETLVKRVDRLEKSIKQI